MRECKLAIHVSGVVSDPVRTETSSFKKNIDPKAYSCYRATTRQLDRESQVYSLRLVINEGWNKKFDKEKPIFLWIIKEETYLLMRIIQMRV